MENLLKNLGLKRQEILVYLGLLEYGPLSVSDISKKTGLYRPAIYSALATLTKRGLVSVSLKKKHKFYVAESPKKLRELLNAFSGNLDASIKELEEKYKTRSSQPQIRVLEGVEGIRAVFNDVVETLHKKDVFYRYNSEVDLDEVNKYLPQSYREKRDAKQLERLVISNYVSGRKKKPRLERAIKFMPLRSEEFEQNVIQLIYGTKVAVIDLNTKTSLIIENTALADFQAKIFRLLYKKI